MLRQSILVLVLGAVANGITVNEANTFMDDVLHAHQVLIARTPGLSSPVPIPDFDFVVNKTRVTNLHLTVSVRDGAIRGLETALHRVGDCQQPVVKEDRRIIVCPLHLNGVSSTFFAHARGDNLLNSHKKVWVNVTVQDTVGQIETVAGRGQHGSLQTFTIDRVYLRTEYDSILSLNGERGQKFKDRFEDEVQRRLQGALFGEYKDLLASAVASTLFPRD